MSASPENLQSTGDPAAAPVNNLSYEDAREQLLKVVNQLEAGGVSLEQSLALWERGEKLADHCEQWLEGARKRLAAARSQDNAPEA